MFSYYTYNFFYTVHILKVSGIYLYLNDLIHTVKKLLNIIIDGSTFNVTNAIYNRIETTT